LVFFLNFKDLGGLHLSIYAKKQIMTAISRTFRLLMLDVSIGKVPTGDGGLSNKGGIGISFRFHEYHFLIINSHLCGNKSTLTLAHQSKIRERNHDFEKIEQGLNSLEGKYNRKIQFPNHASDRYDYCFWLGDLNYRVDGTHKIISKCIQENRLEVLLNNDQLLKEMKSSKGVFKGFKEETISFLPTYKFIKSEYSIGRNSSWSKISVFKSIADRILFKQFNEDAIVKCMYYTSILNTFGSDHQPVVSSFTLEF
jgi:hypothetical protein